MSQDSLSYCKLVSNSVSKYKEHLHVSDSVSYCTLIIDSLSNCKHVSDSVEHCYMLQIVCHT